MMSLLIVSRQGHSAWGEFLLRGRVRLWDGMVTLVKEYSVRLPELGPILC
jgi:hypothetical protein